MARKASTTQFIMVTLAGAFAVWWYLRRRSSRPAFDHVTQYDDQGRPIPPLPPVD